MFQQSFSQIRPEYQGSTNQAKLLAYQNIQQRAYENQDKIDKIDDLFSALDVDESFKGSLDLIKQNVNKDIETALSTTHLSKIGNVVTNITREIKNNDNLKSMVLSTQNIRKNDERILNGNYDDVFKEYYTSVLRPNMFNSNIQNGDGVIQLEDAYAKSILPEKVNVIQEVNAYLKNFINPDSIEEVTESLILSLTDNDLLNQQISNESGIYDTKFIEGEEVITYGDVWDRIKKYATNPYSPLGKYISSLAKVETELARQKEKLDDGLSISEEDILKSYFGGYDMNELLNYKKTTKRTVELELGNKYKGITEENAPDIDQIFASSGNPIRFNQLTGLPTTVTEMEESISENREKLISLYTPVGQDGTNLFVDPKKQLEFIKLLKKDDNSNSVVENTYQQVKTMIKENPNSFSPTAIVNIEDYFINLKHRNDILEMVMGKDYLASLNNTVLTETDPNTGASTNYTTNDLIKLVEQQALEYANQKGNTPEAINYYREEYLTNFNLKRIEEAEKTTGPDGVTSTLPYTPERELEFNNKYFGVNTDKNIYSHISTYLAKRSQIQDEFKKFTTDPDIVPFYPFLNETDTKQAIQYITTMSEQQEPSDENGITSQIINKDGDYLSKKEIGNLTFNESEIVFRGTGFVNGKLMYAFKPNADENEVFFVKAPDNEYIKLFSKSPIGSKNNKQLPTIDITERLIRKQLSNIYRGKEARTITYIGINNEMNSFTVTPYFDVESKNVKYRVSDFSNIANQANFDSLDDIALIIRSYLEEQQYETNSAN